MFMIPLLAKFAFIIDTLPHCVHNPTNPKRNSNNQNAIPKKKRKTAVPKAMNLNT